MRAGARRDGDHDAQGGLMVDGKWYGGSLAGPGEMARRGRACTGQWSRGGMMAADRVRLFLGCLVGRRDARLYAPTGDESCLVCRWRQMAVAREGARAPPFLCRLLDKRRCYTHCRRSSIAAQSGAGQYSCLCIGFLLRLHLLWTNNYREMPIA